MQDFTPLVIIFVTALAMLLLSMRGRKEPADLSFEDMIEQMQAEIDTERLDWQEWADSV